MAKNKITTYVIQIVLTFPALVYTIVNYYTYLFDGWKLNNKFPVALVLGLYCIALILFAVDELVRPPKNGVK